tara:strand:- start:3455 stop:3760 length:306 start_codon:yes stop_codon:yes gene_type:complete
MAQRIIASPASGSPADQDLYFDTVVAQLFEQAHPNQLLFSYLDPNQVCIGYGELVHINWRDQYAKLSFIMATDLEKEHFFRSLDYVSLFDQGGGLHSFEVA